MTDDRELVKFLPPLPKISGSVMRAVVALSGLSGLPVGKAQMIGKQADLSSDCTTMSISTLVVIMGMFIIFWSVARSNQADRDRGDERPGLTQQEMVERSLGEYEDGDQEYGAEEQEVMDRFIATYRPPQRGNSDSDDVTDDIEIEQPETAEERDAR